MRTSGAISTALEIPELVDEGISGSLRVLRIDIPGHGSCFLWASVMESAGQSYMNSLSRLRHSTLVAALGGTEESSELVLDSVEGAELTLRLQYP